MKREVCEAQSSSLEAIVKVSIGTFARSSLETHFGSDLAKVMREACIHYARRLRSGRRPRGVPSFHRVLEPSNGSTRVAFTLQSSIRSQLEGEARRQQVLAIIGPMKRR